MEICSAELEDGMETTVLERAWGTLGRRQVSASFCLELSRGCASDYGDGETVGGPFRLGYKEHVNTCAFAQVI